MRSMTPGDYRQLKAAVIVAGFGDEIKWAETVGAPESAEGFALEAAFVICNSGMKWTVARMIYARVRTALMYGRPVIEVFGHPGKAAAIDWIWREREELWRGYKEAEDPLVFLVALPWIGEITKFHLGKNLGLDLMKPDRHLVRIAEHYQTTPEALCSALSEATGDRIGVVDLVLWRSAERGLIKTLWGRAYEGHPF